MRYVCVHCDHSWDAPADPPPKRCPSCLRANGAQRAVESEAAKAPAKRSRASVLVLLALSILAAVGGYFVWGRRPTAGEPGGPGPVTGAALHDALTASQVEAGALESMLAPDPAIGTFAEQTAAKASGPYERADAVTRAIRARASALAFVPWSLGEPRATPIGTAAQTFSVLQKDGARAELYPIEVAAVAVAALRSLSVDAMVAELISVEGARSPLDPSGFLGYFVVAVFPGEPGLGAPRLFDPYGGQALDDKARHAVLRDQQVIGVALATRALHEVSYLADPKRALESSSDALALAGTLPSVRTVRGMVVLAGRLGEEGVSEFTAARQLRDDPPRKHNLATATLMMGDLARAEKDLDASLEKTPDFANAIATRATVALMKNEPERARSELARAAEIAPDLSLVQWGQVELALRDGETERALAIAKRALASRPSFDTRLRMAMLMRQLGDGTGLRAQASALVEMVPSERKDEVKALITGILGAAAFDASAPIERDDAPAAAAAPSAAPEPPAGAGQQGKSRGQLRLRDDDQRLKLDLNP